MTRANRGFGDTFYTDEVFGKINDERDQPEPTLLYQFVEAYYPALVHQLTQQAAPYRY